MTATLRIHVDLLAGCYDAHDNADAEPRAEWPPSPARLVSALVRGACRAGVDHHRLGLLAEQAPAVIWAAHDAERNRVHSFRPEPATNAGKPTVGPAVWAGADADACAFDWHLDGIDAEVVELVELAAAHVGAFGRSSSPAVFTVELNPADVPAGLDRWAPVNAGGTPVRVPHPGYLNTLDRVHQLGDVGRKARPVCPRARYAPAPLNDTPTTGWVIVTVLQFARPRPVAQTISAAERVRSAFLAHVGDNAARIAGKTKEHGVAFLPLPWVGTAHADGMLRGVAVAAHESLTASELDTVLAAAAAIELPGMTVPVEPPATLRPWTWSRTSDVWTSVSPLVLPTHGSSWGRRASIAADAIERACGLRPVEVTAGPYPALGGVWPRWTAESTVRRPGCRQHVWATAQFDQPITGPLFAGRTGMFGVGLFAPIGGTR